MNSPAGIRVLGNRLLVETIEPEYHGRIYVPHAFREKKREAIVRQLGSPVNFTSMVPRDRRKKPRMIKAQSGDVKVGDRIVIKVPGWEVPRLVNGKQYWIVSAHDVIGIVERFPACSGEKKGTNGS